MMYSELLHNLFEIVQDLKEMINDLKVKQDILSEER